MVKKLFIALFLISLAISIITPFLSGGDFQHFLILVLIVFVAMSFLLLALISYGIEKVTKYSRQVGPSKVLLSLAIIFGIQIVSLPVIRAIEYHRIEKAKIFCEKYISKLEEYHSVHGQYPETISLFQLSDKKPEFLDGQNLYHRTEDGFVFTFETPGSFIGFNLYDSKEGKWRFVD